MRCRVLPIISWSSVFFLTTSYELITDYRFINPHHPVHVDAEFREVGKAKFRTHPVKGSHAVYQDAHAFLYYSHFLNPNNALSWKVGYSFLDFNWRRNPRFRDHDYNFVNASLGWITTSVKDWRWILSTGVSVDATSFNFGQTGVYYGMMWGRYCYSPTLGMHIGWAGYAGVRNGYLVPILGIDWQASKHWRFNAIFPINVSLEFLWNKYVSTAVEFTTFVRPYRFPMRAHGGFHGFNNGIFEIYSNGVELDFNVHKDCALCASVGGGWNFGGWILIKDHANHHAKYYKFNGAPYGQAKLTFTF